MRGERPNLRRTVAQYLEYTKRTAAVGIHGKLSCGRKSRQIQKEWDLSMTSTRLPWVVWILATIAAVPAVAQKLAWESLFRSSGGGDQCTSAAVDSTGAYVAGFLGTVGGTFPGQTGSGSGPDSFVRKYDTSGNELWTRQFGTGKPVFALGMAAGGGGVYVVGRGSGTFPGQMQVLSEQAFVIKYDSNGNQQWVREFASTEGVEAHAVATDATGVYVVGTADGALPGQMGFGNGGCPCGSAFIRKYDHNGTELWTREFTVAGNEGANGVAVNSTGVYMVGEAAGVFPNANVDSSGFFNFWVRKYDVDGNEQWTSQFGPGQHMKAAAVDGTGVYAVGYMGGGALPGQTSSGGLDAFVKKYDLNGNPLWARQFGTGASDIPYGAGSDGNGVFLVGNTLGILPGQTSAGGYDAYIRKYDTSGNEIWTLQFGRTGDDRATGVAANSSGVYISGNSFGMDFAAKIGFGPVVFDGGVVNNASFAPSPAPVAPGSIAAVFGTSLNDGSMVLFSSFDKAGKLVTTLGGASVTINDVPAPMFYSTPGQLGFQVPFELATAGSAKLKVTVAGQTSAAITLAVDGLAPGFFSATQDGKGAAAALHSDGKTPVTAQKPAKPNEVIVLFGTGLGLLTPSLPTGEAAKNNSTAVTPTLTIDGKTADVQFSGAAPGFVGLNQVNVKIPSGTRAAPDIPIALTIGEKQSNTVTIAVSK
jgi:uncharacterized protein (TIGR03437 family)